MNITYAQNGDYLIPNIVIRKTKPLGHYGRLRKAYLKMVFYPFNIFVSCCTDAPGRMEERCCIMRSLDSCVSR